MKEKRKTDGEDRTELYRDWRRSNFGNNRYVFDVDQIEYRFRNGEPEPVAIIELTRSDFKSSDPAKLLTAVLGRIKDKAHGKMLNLVAAALGVHAYIVCFEKDLSTFYVYNLTDDRGWATFSQYNYQQLINAMHEEVING